jgi:hypothetical protein
MSGHWRFFVTTSLLFAGLSTLPAFSNPLTDLFNVAPKEAAAPAPVQVACVPQPGKPVAGKHWVYRVDGHRKCWFQADEATVSVRRQIQLHAAKRSAIVAGENEAAPRKREVLDARAQLLSAAPTGGPQATAPAPQTIDTASVPASEATPPVREAPTAAWPTTDQVTPDRATRPSVDVEMLLAASTLDQDTPASSMPPPTPDAPSVASLDDWGLMAAHVGMLLIVLGFAFLFGSLLASRFLETPIRPGLPDL